MSTFWVKVLWERARVVMISEYLTSQVCSNCSTRLAQYRSVNTWRSKRCPNELCKRKWNRDVNAAINMLRILFHARLFGVRHPWHRHRKVD